jgi:hypothetical protein
MMSMIRLSIRALLPVIVLAALASHGFAASDGPLDRATLKGIKSFAVIMDPLGAELTDHGLSVKTVSKYVEIRLEQAGIQVSPDAKEFLGLRVLSAQSGKKGPMAVAITIGLYQQVELVRDTAAKTATDTWGAQSILLTGANQVNESVSETIDELVQRFVTAYRSVNQPEPAAPAAPASAAPAPAPEQSTPKDR